jgi:hypothetical protein
METYTEKRKQERIHIALPCLLSLVEDSVLSKTMEITALNISAGGVLLAPSQKLHIMDFAQIDIIIPSQKAHHSSEGCAAHISANGYVVRRDSVGIAMAFDQHYRVAPLDNALINIRKKVSWMMNQRRMIGFEEASSPFMAGGNAAHGRDRFRLEKI